MSFADIHTLQELSDFLGCSVQEITAYINLKQKLSLYRKHEIPKRNKRHPNEYRVVYQTHDTTLARLQKNIGTHLASSIPFADCVQGFCKGKSIVTNAKEHLMAKYLLHADIENFFDTISTRQVAEQLVVLGWRSELATAIAELCTMNGKLIQGASSSPVLANLVCRALDADLLLLAQSIGGRYTRYADDICISGANAPSLDAVREIVLKHGFVLKNNKCRLQKRGRNQYVTGLTISDPLGPRLPKRAKRKMRQILYYSTRFGFTDHIAHVKARRSVRKEAARISGQIFFMLGVEKRLAQKYLAEWSRVLKDTAYTGVLRFVFNKSNMPPLDK